MFQRKFLSTEAIKRFKTFPVVSAVFRLEVRKVSSERVNGVLVTVPEGGQFSAHTATADIPAELEVKLTYTGHLLVHPLIDGQDVGWFVFDTGAGGNCTIAKPSISNAQMPAPGTPTANIPTPAASA